MKKTYNLKGLDCPNCAIKIEEKLNQLDGVKLARIDFLNSKLILETKEEQSKEKINQIKKIIQQLEPIVTIEETIPEERNQKKELYPFIIGLIFFTITMILSHTVLVKYKIAILVLFIINYWIVGKEVVWKAIQNIRKADLFDENFLMTIATIGALLIGEYPEAVAVMLFYQLGELFQKYAVNQSRKSITNLMDLRADYANVEENGKLIQKNPNMVKIGDIILIKPGEKIPLDGIVEEGSSFIDTKALTGEFVPKKVSIGEPILSGCINQEGILKVKVTCEWQESTVSKILELVENASSRKSESENFITKFSKYYTPIVVGLAILLALLPPLLIKNTSFSVWIYRALSFLVVSCPCALVISIPLSFFGGIGAAAKKGILIKGSNYLEALSQIETLVFDKTGTLTEGVFEVKSICPVELSQAELLKLVAYAESLSSHPIANSIKRTYGKEIDNKIVSDVKELSGLGIIAKIEGKEIIVGNEKLMKKYHINFPKKKECGTILYAAINKKYAGWIVISDKIKENMDKTMKKFKQMGIKKLVMLTGDKLEIANEVSKKLKIDTFYAELLPAQKVEKMKNILQMKTPNKKVAFVGDGINDAPVLALSDIGIAMGGLGSDAAIEAADIVLMTDEPSKIVPAIDISKHTLKIVKQNICFAIGVKIAVLILSALGIATMWSAVFADVGVSVLAILNALRLLKIK